MAKKKSTRRTLIEWGLILGVIAVLYFSGLHTEVIGTLQRGLLWTGIFHADTEIPVQQQQVADYDLSLRTFDGKYLSLKEYRGKTIFLNFWASWCPPCVAEMPSIQSLYDKVASKDIRFVMVSVDQEKKAAEAFIRKHNFTFPVYQIVGRLPEVYSSNTIPTTFVVSPEGKIVAKRKGMARYDTKKFRTFLQSQIDKP